MSDYLDSWPVLAWLDGEEPAAGIVSHRSVRAEPSAAFTPRTMIPSVGETDPEHAMEQLLGEQLAYYRAVAPGYLRSAPVPLQGSEAVALRRDVGAAFDAHFRGDVLELACGPGTWTAMLADRARSLTAVDGAPEMLSLAAEVAPGANVRFVQSDPVQLDGGPHLRRGVLRLLALARSGGAV